MPQTPIKCGFKVLKKNHNTPLLWMNKKKHSVHLCNSACWCAFISVMPGVWIWTAPRVILKKLFTVIAAEELPAKHSLSAHCAENSQTRPFNYYFLSVADTHCRANIYQERLATVGEEENRTGGERGQERGMEERGGGGGLLEPGRGHDVPVERNSEKHP